ncbi:hypothetical protein D3C85_1907350 [compost metagenome]
MVNAKTGELLYTVYAAPQRFSAELELQELGLQRFAILWDENHWPIPHQLSLP